MRESVCVSQKITEYVGLGRDREAGRGIVAKVRAVGTHSAPKKEREPRGVSWSGAVLVEGEATKANQLSRRDCQRPT